MHPNYDLLYALDCVRCFRNSDTMAKNNEWFLQISVKVYSYAAREQGSLYCSKEVSMTKKLPDCNECLLKVSNDKNMFELRQHRVDSKRYHL